MRQCPASELAAPDLAIDDVPAIVAGTLCLMSCFAQHPHAAYAERVTENLLRLGDDVALSPELRAVCARLAERWNVLGGIARVHAEHGIAAIDTRALH